ncbi:hypothetical protein ISS85_00885 [Candidatus Microgenomates bacterium]|nr:hypothetical protein [Candidatus Microgenomates bacterium]
MSERLRGYDAEIVAGPCSFDPETARQYDQIAGIEVLNGSGERQRAVYGTRVVGLKSRTGLSPDGQGMGVDFPFYEQFLIVGKRPEGIPPSVAFAEKFCQETGLLIATEIMIPHIQLPWYEGRIPRRKLMPWNPAVNQLGHQVLEMAQFAEKNGWDVGIKNGKWLGGVDLEQANNPNLLDMTSLQKTWQGLASWAQNVNGGLILIHRGVDVPGKGDYRNAPVHEIARRAKKATGARLYLDPSHMNGPGRRDMIVEDTIKAMRMENGNGPLYNGVLIEVGESKTDTGQHITVAELGELVRELAKFRRLRPPDPVGPKKHFVG